MTPLHLAVSSGSVRIVQKLLKYGANKDIKNSEGLTALDMAKKYKFNTIQKILVIIFDI